MQKNMFLGYIFILFSSVSFLLFTDVSTVHSGTETIEIDLYLKNNSGYFLEGEEGCCPSIDGIGTLYYSAANIKLDEIKESTIALDSKKIKLVD